MNLSHIGDNMLAFIEICSIWQFQCNFIFGLSVTFRRLILFAVMAAFWMTCAHLETTVFRLSLLSPWLFLLRVERCLSKSMNCLVFFIAKFLTSEFRFTDLLRVQERCVAKPLRLPSKRTSPSGSGAAPSVVCNTIGGSRTSSLVPVARRRCSFVALRLFI
jgi:hypothetical protein